MRGADKHSRRCLAVAARGRDGLQEHKAAGMGAVKQWLLPGACDHWGKGQAMLQVVQLCLWSPDRAPAMGQAAVRGYTRRRGTQAMTLACLATQ